MQTCRTPPVGKVTETGTAAALFQTFLHTRITEFRKKEGRKGWFCHEQAINPERGCLCALAQIYGAQRWRLRGHQVHFIPSFIQLFLPPPSVSEGRQRLDREAGFLNDTDEDLIDYQKSSKLSELYSATVPSIDSALSSWDSSGFDACYGSQGRPGEDPSHTHTPPLPPPPCPMFPVLVLTDVVVVVVVVFRDVPPQSLRLTDQPKRVAADPAQEPGCLQLRRPPAPFSNV